MANDEWQTPNGIIEDVRILFGGNIDLDAASNEHSNKRIRAEKYFSDTFQDNALNNSWYAKNVFMNPPYSRIIKNFVIKFIHEYEKEHFEESIVLVNSDTGAKWYHLLCSRSSAWVITIGRISFLDKSDTPVKGNRMSQTIFYFGHRTKEFETLFKKYGLVIGRI